MKELTPIVGMKNWDKKEKRWIGVICQAQRDDKGNDGIVIFDIVSSNDEFKLDILIQKSIDKKAWLVN